MVENKAVPVYIHITVVRREYDDLTVRFHLLFSHLSKELRPKGLKISSQIKRLHIEQFLRVPVVV